MGTEREPLQRQPHDFCNKLISSERCEKKLHSLACKKKKLKGLERTEIHTPPPLNEEYISVKFKWKNSSRE